MHQITIMHAKLHRVVVTEARVDYVGSITIDQNLLDAVGLLPLQEVEIVNVSNGNRWSTYVLPGRPGGGEICPNGGGALLCRPGDLLIIWANDLVPRSQVLAQGHSAKIALVDEKNRIRKLFEQALRPVPGGVRFESEITHSVV